VWREVVETMARPHARPAIAPVTPGEILKEEFLAECLMSRREFDGAIINNPIR
jgi:hypothetical protein